MGNQKLENNFHIKISDENIEKMDEVIFDIGAMLKNNHKLSKALSAHFTYIILEAQERCRNHGIHKKERVSEKELQTRMFVLTNFLVPLMKLYGLQPMENLDGYLKDYGNGHQCS